MLKSPFKSACLFCLALLLIISTIATFKPTASESQNQVVSRSSSQPDVSISALEFLKTLNNEDSVKSSGHSSEQVVEYKSINLSNATLIKKNEEITDLNELIKIAKKDKSEFINSSNKEVNTKNIMPSEKSSDDKVLQVNHYEASQLLEEYIDTDNNEVEVYAVTKLVEVMETSDLEDSSSIIDTELNITPLSNNNSELNVQNTSSKNDSKWDPTLGVKAYSTIYVTKSTTTKGTFLDLSSVSGGWSISDNSYSLTNMRVRLNQTGVSSSGSFNQHVDKYPTSRTWSYTAPTTSWPPVSAETTGAGTAYVGAGQYTRITRGSSSWQFDWSNNW